MIWSIQIGIAYSLSVTSEHIEAAQQFQDAAQRKNDEDVIRTLTALKEEFLKLPFYNTYMKTLGWIDMYLAAPEHIDTIYEDIDKLSFFHHAAEDIPLIQKQYAWFILQTNCWSLLSKTNTAAIRSMRFWIALFLIFLANT